MDVSTDTTTSEPTNGSTDSVDTSPAETTQEASSDTTAKPDDSIEGFIAAKQQGALGTATPAYVPSYKYKANNEEKELPELFRGLIKDAATEKQVKELFEKADGLEGVKRLRDEQKAKYEAEAKAWESQKSSIDPVVNGYKAAVHYWQAAGYNEKSGFKDLSAMDNLFRTLNLPEKALYHYVSQKLNVNDLPPEHQSIYNRQQELAQQNYLAQQQLAQYQQQELNQKLSQAENLVAQAMSQPGIAEAVQKYNADKGYPDAFRQEIIMRGKIYGEAGNHKMPDEIAKEIVANYGLSQAPQQAIGVVTPNTQAASKPAVIPVVKGGGVSTVKRKIKSIDDISAAFNALE